ncbi:hypothetical protein [Lysinibacillus odysseyi]|uniref:Uncharacterized protein n=1 Tax=Lysinibacillus odysseyi 34hs-1 = NBRC 100172 TaxID=1220589 RepID=A0A0A3ID68_9BACI|nr:hypothetical protein [Lysinibacillus odysseyi]KGR82689.1 hypothetical protein CD32_17700 [Lysinibacillus odysseyi 34hs-1 = NBRC 100172]
MMETYYFLFVIIRGSFPWRKIQAPVFELYAILFFNKKMRSDFTGAGPDFRAVKYSEKGR